MMFNKWFPKVRKGTLLSSKCKVSFPKKSEQVIWYIDGRRDKEVIGKNKSMKIYVLNPFILLKMVTMYAILYEN